MSRRLAITAGAALITLCALDARAELIPPRLVKFVPAQLPPDTPVQDVTVVLWITIDERGGVMEAEIRDGAGPPWDAAALEAARQFVFDPAVEDGEPIPVRVPFSYRFRAPHRRGSFIPSRLERRGLQPVPGYRYGGTVLEKGTRKPLAGILVTVKEADQQWEAFSADDGRFVVDGLPPGQVELQIVTGEHEPVVEPVRGKPLPPEAEVPSMRTIYLDPVGVPEYLTVVKDKPPAKAATEISLTEDELTKTPGTLGDPTRVVQTLPGVARSPFGLGYYVVRGASFENTGFFIDDHPALLLYHLGGGPGVIPGELVREITFYPGGYPVRLGRFATGAIVVDTKSPPNDRWHLDVSVDIFRAAALFSIPFDEGKGQVTASFRRSYYDLFLPLIQDGLELAYLDYQLRVTYDFTPRIRARFISLGSEDDFAQQSEPDAGGDPARTRFGLGFHRLLAGVDIDLTDDLTLVNSIAWEYDHNDGQRTSEDDATINADLDGWFLSIRSGIQWRPLDNVIFDAGVDALLTHINVDLNVPSLPPLGDPRPPEFDPIIFQALATGQAYSTALYAQVDWEVVDGLRLIPGVRGNFDYYGGSVKPTVDPRLSIRYRVHPEWTVTAMGAMTHQVPAPFQYEEPFGDPDVPPIRGVQASAGVEWEPGDGWEVKVEGFYNHLFNMSRPNAELDPDGDGLARSFWSSDMQGRGYGMEVLVRKRFGGRFFGWVSYTLSRAERLRPPSEEWVLFEQDQTHIFNFAGTVQLGADWSVGARFTLTTGNFYYPVVGSRYDADRDNYQPVFAGEPERLPVFHRLDLRIDKRFRFETWMLEVYLDVQNVYNAGNPETQRYSYDFRIQTEGFGVPILPTLGVRAVF